MKKKILTLSNLFFLSISLSSCSILSFWDDSVDGKTKLVFFGWGNSAEVSLTEEFVDEFNNSQDEIYVEYTPIASDSYATKIRNALSRSNVPDVIIAGDGEIKPWIENDGLCELDEFIENSKVFDLDDFWLEGQNRYYYNKKIRMNYSDSIKDEFKSDFHYYGIMRDLSPSVLFYNVQALEKVGINIISIPEDKIDEYNEKHNTSYDKVGYKEYETCVDETLKKTKNYDNTKDVYRVFNNQIPLTWEWDDSLEDMNGSKGGKGELMELSKILTKTSSYTLPSTRYGIFYNNWFSLGWSVGANSLQWIEDDSKYIGGRYEFSLGDKNKNYKVKEGEQVTINSHFYNENELIRYQDLPTINNDSTLKEKCYELPSSLEATQFYVDLSSKWGYSPKPDFTASTSQYALFSSGNSVAMTLDTRYSVGIWRKSIKKSGQSGGFDRDCAPCPVHINGIKSGHSGSLAYCIPKKSKNKEAAFKFIEYINGEEGQTAFAKEGYTIPNTKTLSNSDSFLVKGAKPYNSEIFIDAASYQKVGDWGFLPDKDWITIWATEFNSKVLSGSTTLEESIQRTKDRTQSKIDEYYKDINK